MSSTAADSIADVHIPDTELVTAITAHIRAAEDDLLFNHSRRVFLFGVLQGRRRGLRPDLERFDPAFARDNFVDNILGNTWPE
jgi:hypothetical protein